MAACWAAAKLGRQAGGFQDPRLSAVFTTFTANTPSLYLDVDRDKAQALQVPISSIFSTLQATLGGYYVNDFNLFGRTWQVNVQADTPFRMEPDDVRRIQVRNGRGQMVPLGTLAAVEDRGGPFVITRYNMYPAAAINGTSLPGTERDTERMELESHWNNSRKHKPLRRNG